MNKDWAFAGDKYTCGIRTAGVLIKDNKILVQREKNGNEYALPGCHIKIGETLKDGLVREMAEELGVGIKCVRQLWSEECFWKWNGRQAHTIAFYYRIELCDGSDIPEGVSVSQKDNCNVVIEWLPIDELRNVTVYPDFLKEEIYHLNEPIKHFVSKGQ